MKALFAGLILATALVVAPTAGADPPSVQVNDFSSADTSYSPCGAFEVAWTNNVHMVMTTFTDSTGAPVRYQLHVRTEGTMTGPTGNVATITSTVTQTTVLAARIMSVDGTITNVWAPGVGMLLHDVGRTTQDMSTWPATILSMSGMHPTLEPGAWDPVCAYLAGP